MRSNRYNQDESPGSGSRYDKKLGSQSSSIWQQYKEQQQFKKYTETQRKSHLDRRRSKNLNYKEHLTDIAQKEEVKQELLQQSERKLHRRFSEAGNLPLLMHQRKSSLINPLDLVSMLSKSFQAKKTKESNQNIEESKEQPRKLNLQHRQSLKEFISDPFLQAELFENEEDDASLSGSMQSESDDEKDYLQDTEEEDKIEDQEEKTRLERLKNIKRVSQASRNIEFTLDDLKKYESNNGSFEKEATEKGSSGQDLVKTIHQITTGDSRNETFERKENQLIEHGEGCNIKSTFQQFESTFKNSSVQVEEVIEVQTQSATLVEGQLGSRESAFEKKETPITIVTKGINSDDQENQDFFSSNNIKLTYNRNQNNSQMEEAMQNKTPSQETEREPQTQSFPESQNTNSSTKLGLTQPEAFKEQNESDFKKFSDRENISGSNLQFGVGNQQEQGESSKNEKEAGGELKQTPSEKDKKTTTTVNSVQTSYKTVKRGSLLISHLNLVQISENAESDQKTEKNQIEKSERSEALYINSNEKLNNDNQTQNSFEEIEAKIDNFAKKLEESGSLGKISIDQAPQGLFKKRGSLITVSGIQGVTQKDLLEIRRASQRFDFAKDINFLKKANKKSGRDQKPQRQSALVVKNFNQINDNLQVTENTEFNQSQKSSDDSQFKKRGSVLYQDLRNSLSESSIKESIHEVREDLNEVKEKTNSDQKRGSIYYRNISNTLITDGIKAFIEEEKSKELPPVQKPESSNQQNTRRVSSLFVQVFNPVQKNEEEAREPNAQNVEINGSNNLEKLAQKSEIRTKNQLDFQIVKSIHRDDEENPDRSLQNDIRMIRESISIVIDNAASKAYHYRNLTQEEFEENNRLQSDQSYRLDEIRDNTLLEGFVNIEEEAIKGLEGIKSSILIIENEQIHQDQIMKEVEASNRKSMKLISEQTLYPHKELELSDLVIKKLTGTILREYKEELDHNDLQREMEKALKKQFDRVEQDQEFEGNLVLRESVSKMKGDILSQFKDELDQESITNSILQENHKRNSQLVLPKKDKNQISFVEKELSLMKSSILTDHLEELNQQEIDRQLSHDFRRQSNAILTGIKLDDGSVVDEELKAILGQLLIQYKEELDQKHILEEIENDFRRQSIRKDRKAKPCKQKIAEEELKKTFCDILISMKEDLDQNDIQSQIKQDFRRQSIRKSQINTSLPQFQILASNYDAWISEAIIQYKKKLDQDYILNEVSRSLRNQSKTIEVQEQVIRNTIAEKELKETFGKLLLEFKDQFDQEEINRQIQKDFKRQTLRQSQIQRLDQNSKGVFLRSAQQIDQEGQSTEGDFNHSNQFRQQVTKNGMPSGRNQDLTIFHKQADIVSDTMRKMTGDILESYKNELDQEEIEHELKRQFQRQTLIMESEDLPFIENENQELKVKKMTLTILDEYQSNLIPLKAQHVSKNQSLVTPSLDSDLMETLARKSMELHQSNILLERKSSLDLENIKEQITRDLGHQDIVIQDEENYLKRVTQASLQDIQSDILLQYEEELKQNSIQREIAEQMKHQNDDNERRFSTEQTDQFTKRTTTTTTTKYSMVIQQVHENETFSKFRKTSLYEHEKANDSKRNLTGDIEHKKLNKKPVIVQNFDEDVFRPDNKKTVKTHFKTLNHYDESQDDLDHGDLNRLKTLSMNNTQRLMSSLFEQEAKDLKNKRQQGENNFDSLKKLSLQNTLEVMKFSIDLLEDQMNSDAQVAEKIFQDQRKLSIGNSLKICDNVINKALKIQGNEALNQYSEEHSSNAVTQAKPDFGSNFDLIKKLSLSNTQLLLNNANLKQEMLNQSEQDFQKLKSSENEPGYEFHFEHEIEIIKKLSLSNTENLLSKMNLQSMIFEHDKENTQQEFAQSNLKGNPEFSSEVEVMKRLSASNTLILLNDAYPERKMGDLVKREDAEGVQIEQKEGKSKNNHSFYELEKKYQVQSIEADKAKLEALRKFEQIDFEDINNTDSIGVDKVVMEELQQQENIYQVHSKASQQNMKHLLSKVLSTSPLIADSGNSQRFQEFTENPIKSGFQNHENPDEEERLTILETKTENQKNLSSKQDNLIQMLEVLTKENLESLVRRSISRNEETGPRKTNKNLPDFCEDISLNSQSIETKKTKIQEKLDLCEGSPLNASSNNYFRENQIYFPNFASLKFDNRLDILNEMSDEDYSQDEFSKIIDSKHKKQRKFPSLIETKIDLMKGRRFTVQPTRKVKQKAKKDTSLKELIDSNNTNIRKSMKEIQRMTIKVVPNFLNMMEAYSFDEEDWQDVFDEETKQQNQKKQASRKDKNQNQKLNMQEQYEKGIADQISNVGNPGYNIRKVSYLQMQDQNDPECYTEQWAQYQMQYSLKLMEKMNEIQKNKRTSALIKEKMIKDLIGNKISNSFLIHCLKRSKGELAKLNRLQIFLRTKIKTIIQNKIENASRQLKRESRMIELKNVLRKSQCIN